MVEDGLLRVFQLSDEYIWPTVVAVLALAVALFLIWMITAATESASPVKQYRYGRLARFLAAAALGADIVFAVVLATTTIGFQPKSLAMPSGFITVSA